MRVGRDVDSIFNRLLEENVELEMPGKFEGSKDRKTRVLVYELFTPPDMASAILSREYWYSFIAIMQLVEKNRPFYVLPSTLDVLKKLIPQSLSYFHGYPENRSYSQLIGCDSWRDLVMEKGYTNGLRDVDLIFKKGLTAKQFK